MKTLECGLLAVITDAVPSFRHQRDIHFRIRIYLQKRMGNKSGDLAGYSMKPTHPMHLPGNITSRNCCRVKALWRGSSC